MTHYIALIEKDADSGFGVSFPDVPGVFSAGETLDEAIANAGEALSFAAEDWAALTGVPFPRARSIDELRHDNAFADAMGRAIVAAIPLDGPMSAAA